MADATTNIGTVPQHVKQHNAIGGGGKAHPSFRITVARVNPPDLRIDFGVKANTLVP